MENTSVCPTLTLEGIAPRSNLELAQTAGLVLERVELPNFCLYAAFYKGTLFYTVFCEQYDEPARWESRIDGEKRAMIQLAMDEWADVFGV